MNRPAPNVKPTQQKQPQPTSQPKDQEQPQPNWFESYIKDVFSKSGVILPPLLNFPETVALPNGDIKVTYRVLDGALYRMYIFSLFTLYALAAFGAGAIGGEDGSWIALPIIAYFFIDLFYMPKANRGFRQWWLNKSFQRVWQNKCLKWFSRQVTFAFNAQQIIVTHALLNVVYHRDRVKREAVERAVTGGFVGFYLAPPHSSDLQLGHELAQKPVLKSWWEWALPMPVAQGDLHLKLFVSDQPLDILHAPQQHADLLHRRLQSILTGQLTNQDIAEINRRKNHV